MPVQPFDDVQISDAPVRLFEVALTAQAHVASVVGVAAVFTYVIPVLQTVTVDAHCVTIEEDERVVGVDW